MLVTGDCGAVGHHRRRALGDGDAPIPGLYCVGEAAGFGGGNANGNRSLEGTFLPGCIMTAKAAEMLGLSRQGLYAKMRRYGIGDLDAPDGVADSV